MLDGTMFAGRFASATTTLLGEAVQVEHTRLTPCVESTLVFQQFESTYPVQAVGFKCEPCTPYVSATEEEQAAAVKLQAMQRGRMARAQVSKLRDQGASDTNIAAEEAEAAMFEGTPEEQAAALRLQAMQRGRTVWRCRMTIA